jgi:C1A family cysteine protease
LPSPQKVNLKNTTTAGRRMCPISEIICLAPYFVYRQNYLAWWICGHSVRKWKIRDNWAVALPTLWPALEFLERKDKVAFEDFSRLFIYYNERAIEHTIKSDSGAMIRDGIKTLNKQGVCSETKWPYLVSKFQVKPTPVCYKDAGKHKITSYRRTMTLDEMRACLAEGFPFVFGFTVYESFESQAVAKTGVVTMPKKGEKSLGGHAVLAVGYNDVKERFIVRNSWGEGWGMKGYFTMPYKYVADRNFSDDFWTIRRGENMIAR